MERDASAFDQNDATGFIRLNALRLKLRAALQARND
jgi:argininosuccinate synthase